MQKQIFLIAFLTLVNATQAASSSTGQLKLTSFQVEDNAQSDLTPFLFTSEKSSPEIWAKFITLRDRSTGNPKIATPREYEILRKNVSNAIEAVLANVTVTDDKDQTVLTLGQGQTFVFDSNQNFISSRSTEVRIKLPSKSFGSGERMNKKDYRLNTQVRAITTRTGNRAFKIKFKQMGNLMFSTSENPTFCEYLTPAITFES